MNRFAYDRTPDGQEDKRRVHLYSPGLESDWANILIDLSGSFAGGYGEILLYGNYPVSPTILGPRTKVIGRSANQNGGDGFHPAEDGQDILVDWDVRGNGYTNYGAGMRNVFLDCWRQRKRAESGASLTASQASSECYKVFVRGHSGYGLKLAGDFFAVSAIHVDARPLHLRQDEFEDEPKGRQGIIADSRLKGVYGAGWTVHNCQVGIDLMDPYGLSLDTIDTETTPIPLRVRYNSRDCHLRNVIAQHSDCIADLSNVRTDKRSFLLHLQGRVDAKADSRLMIPNGTSSPYGTPFDLRLTARSLRK